MEDFREFTRQNCKREVLEVVVRPVSSRVRETDLDKEVTLV